MEKDIKSSQRGKNYVSRTSKTPDLQLPEEKVVFYEKGSVSIASQEPNNLQKLFNVIKSTLHGENHDNSKLCEWQLPPNSKKADCVPVCVDGELE